MRKFLHILLVSLLVSSCGTCRHSFENLRQRDSLAVRIIDSVQLHIIDSTVIRYVNVDVVLPDESRLFVASSGTSHLETSLASSDAFIDSTGLLHHTLENKTGKTISKAVPVADHYHIEQNSDTHQEATVKEIEVERFVEKVVEVEKPLTIWQRFWSRWGWVLTLILTGWILWPKIWPIIRRIVFSL